MGGCQDKKQKMKEFWVVGAILDRFRKIDLPDIFLTPPIIVGT